MKDKVLGLGFNAAVVGGVVAIYNGTPMRAVGGLLALVTVGLLCAGFAARN